MIHRLLFHSEVFIFYNLLRFLPGFDFMSEHNSYCDISSYLTNKTLNAQYYPMKFNLFKSKTTTYHYFFNQLYRYLTGKN